MTAPDRGRTGLWRLAVIPALTLATVLAWVGAGEPVRVHPGVGLLRVDGARPGDSILVERDGRRIGGTTVDEAGAAVISGLPPGSVEVIRRRDGRELTSRTVTVAAIDDPAEIPELTLHPGLNQLPMRDGVHLSAWITLPGPVEDGPYPTVVELSVYRIGDDGMSPLDRTPTERRPVTQPATEAARELGYATVGVNVRGTGCSGGALDFLGDATAADGHDVVEMIASQAWAADSGVGLVGYSFGGLAALRAAATNPPSLTGVAALSVYGDAWSMFHPGGLDNRGFPAGWLEELDRQAEPSGTDWVRERIGAGDRDCARNQELHGQKVDPTTDLVDARFRDDSFNQTSVTTWAPDITVPVLVSSQFQDAAIGADLAEYADWFVGSPIRRLLLTNGGHADGVAPQVLTRYAEFLDLFVADRTPRPHDEAMAALAPLWEGDAPPPGPPPASGAAEADGPDEARERYREAGSVELLWASGAADPPGRAAAARASTHGSWPPDGTRPGTWHLRPGGELDDGAVASGPDARFHTDGTRSGTAWSGSGEAADVEILTDFTAPTPSTALRWTTPPLEGDLVLAGTASVDLWIRTEQDDADLQALLLQVDPDGRETLVQNGWIRAGFRRETDRSTPLHPAIDFDHNAHEPLTPGTWTRVRVPIPSFAHVLPEGSRLRVQVGTPGDGQVRWSFGPQPSGDGFVDVGQSGDRASTLVLPVTDLPIPAPEVDCGALRSQPCRPGGDLVNLEIGG